MREEGWRDRIGWPGEEQPPDPTVTEAAQAPLTLHSIDGDRKGCHELSDLTGVFAVYQQLFVSAFTPRLLKSVCSAKSSPLSNVIASAVLILLLFKVNTQSVVCVFAI